MYRSPGNQDRIPKKFRLRQLSNPYVVLGYACLLFLSVFGWKKLVVLANSTPVATWTLSSWRDFRNKFHGISTVLMVTKVCFVFLFQCFNVSCFILWLPLLWHNGRNYTVVNLWLQYVVDFFLVLPATGPTVTGAVSRCFGSRPGPNWLGCGYLPVLEVLEESNHASSSSNLVNHSLPVACLSAVIRMILPWAVQCTVSMIPAMPCIMHAMPF